MQATLTTIDPLTGERASQDLPSLERCERARQYIVEHHPDFMADCEAQPTATVNLGFYILAAVLFVGLLHFALQRLKGLK